MGLAHSHKVTQPALGRLSRRALLASAAAGAVGSALMRQLPARAAEISLSDALTLDEQIAQMFMFQAWGTSLSANLEWALETVKPGGILLAGGNIQSLEQVKAFASDLHNTNPALPPVIAVDEEGGPITRLPGDPVAGAVVLGQLPTDVVQKLSRDRADFIANVGIDINFAPVADVAYESSSYMHTRSFGSDPTLVAEKVGAFVTGCREVGVLGAAKHFPGHGRTAADSHETLPEVDISREDWLESDALPFKAAIEAHVEMVMLGHLVFPQWDDQPASLSSEAIRILRDDLGFPGVIVTDDLAMGGIAEIDPFAALDRAIDAGVDMLLYTLAPAPWPEVIAHVRKRVDDGAVREERIRSSVTRILAMKHRRFRFRAES